MTGTKGFIQVVLFMCCAVYAHAQLNYDYTQGKFLIKGKVIDVQSRNPVPMANIRLNNGGKGTTCDNDGNFMLYVSRRDTLYFSSTGYSGKIIHMSDIDSTRYPVMEIEMLHDFIKLKEVTVYPFRDLDEFKKAFIDKRAQQLVINGIPPPKYIHKTPTAKIYNPISYFYERLKRKRAANPDFKP